MRKILGLAACVLAIATYLPGQKKSGISIQQIMRGPALTGYEPANPVWSGDNQRIYFQWKKASDAVLQPLDTYVVNRDGSGLRKLTEAESRLTPSSLGDLSRDRKRMVFARDGDLFVHDRESDRIRQLTRTTEAESNPHFTSDGRRIWFTRANNLYLLSLEDGSVEQLTDIRTAAGPVAASGPPMGGFGQGRGGGQQARSGGDEQQRGTDSQEYIKKEERDLLDIVKQRAARREEDEARRKRENPRKPFTLQARQSVASLALSPDGKTVMATLAELPDRAKNTIVPNFITESAFTEDIPSRSKVGDTQARTRLALLDVEKGESKYVEFPEPAPAPAKPEERRPAAPAREVTVGQPVWSEDGSKAFVTARAADNKDRWILALDPATAKTRVLFHDHDDAWIAGGGFGPGAGPSSGWLANNQDIYFLSERTGYSHLYLVSWEGGDPRPLTNGNWEVQTARLSEDKNTFYLTTNEGDPAQIHLYAMPASGGPREKLTTRVGRHVPSFSPDGRWIADLYSYTNLPTELYVMENRAGAELKRLTQSPSAEFQEYGWTDVPIINFKARDGVEVPARMYKPADYRKGGPAVIFVHGAGYTQNVHRWWSSYSHEYMFHHFLMEHGYLVLDVDYRGSAGYGRDWRTAIYRHMGGKDLDDIVDAARYASREQGADPRKIGLYGGSYGGFITLMAMFTQPDVFAAGAALRPVTDWAHYNHPYTSNILNMPQKDAEAYKQSSPIYFAAGLKGALLICHGMVDTNVHFQDSVRLVQRLIELGKDNWELAVFPVEDHGFVQPASWTDEYKRIFKLFEKNLKGSGAL